MFVTNLCINVYFLNKIIQIQWFQTTQNILVLILETDSFDKNQPFVVIENFSTIMVHMYMPRKISGSGIPK